MADVQEFANWAKEQPGIMEVQVNLSTEMISFPEKLIGEMPSAKSSEKISLQKKNA
ncbi:MAG: hypothetical protein ACHQ1H_07145 [Nitrososphaerales archaeon]